MSNQPFNRILVIDDNEAIHQDFVKIFSRRDCDAEFKRLDAELFGPSAKQHESLARFELQFAAQGKEGLEHVRQSCQDTARFGVAFVDMRMPPGWDGVESIEHLWKVDPDLQVVICTAYSDRSWGEIISRLGRSDQLLILKKPFDEIEVVQLACSLCEKRRLLEHSRQQVTKLEGVVETKEQALTEAHQDANVLIESMSSALVTIDARGIVSRWNPVASTLFEIPSIHAVGRPFHALPIRWDDRREVLEAFDECTIVKQNRVDLKFLDQLGNRRILAATICPILNDPTSQARLLLATDVTHHYAMQQQLDQALRMESVGQLAAGVAHEINTPMQYIGDNIRYVAKSIEKLDSVFDCVALLVDESISDDQLCSARKSVMNSFEPARIRTTLEQLPDALKDSIEGVQSVSKIVAAMKEFSHPGDEQKSTFCVNHVLESTITVARNEWKYVADVETDFDAQLGKIHGLPSELNQAFLNILVNAAHAIKDRVEAKDYAKGRIKISTRTEAGFARVTIEDNGGGIPEAVGLKVFEPFFTTKEVGKGTGQGLAIAFSVVTQKHGGSIHFENLEPMGTRFIVDLPIGKDTINQSTEHERAPVLGVRQ